jgi:hypothetical protein
MINLGQIIRTYLIPYMSPIPFFLFPKKSACHDVWALAWIVFDVHGTFSDRSYDLHVVWRIWKLLPDPRISPLIACKTHGPSGTKTGRTHPNHTSPTPCKPVLRSLHGGYRYVNNRYVMYIYIEPKLNLRLFLCRPPRTGQTHNPCWRVSRLGPQAGTAPGPEPRTGNNRARSYVLPEKPTGTTHVHILDHIIVTLRGTDLQDSCSRFAVPPPPKPEQQQVSPLDPPPPPTACPSPVPQRGPQSTRRR